MSAIPWRLAVTLLLLNGLAVAHVPDYLAPQDEQVDLQPATLVRTFLAAVEHDGLTLFGRPVPSDTLRPRRVEYVYDLQSRATTRRIYADLLPATAVPGRHDCEVRGVSVTLSALGTIIDVEAHVWCE